MRSASGLGLRVFKTLNPKTLQPFNPSTLKPTGGDHEVGVRPVVEKRQDVSEHHHVHLLHAWHADRAVGIHRAFVGAARDGPVGPRPRSRRHRGKHPWVVPGNALSSPPHPGTHHQEHQRPLPPTLARTHHQDHVDTEPLHLARPHLRWWSEGAG
jgi:hypothetical protein